MASLCNFSQQCCHISTHQTFMTIKGASHTNCMACPYHDSRRLQLYRTILVLTDEKELFSLHHPSQFSPVLAPNDLSGNLVCSFINSAIHPFLILVTIPPPTIHSYMPYIPQLILRSKVSEKEERFTCSKICYKVVCVQTLQTGPRSWHPESWRVRETSLNIQQ